MAIAERELKSPDPVLLEINRLGPIAKAGDPKAMAELYEIGHPRLKRYFSPRVSGNADLAEDLASETFIRSITNPWEDRGLPFGGWLFRIAHNLLIDHRRRHVNDPHEDLEAAEHIPQSNHRQTDLAIILDQAKTQLTEDQRRVIESRFYEGNPILHTAKRLNKTDESVKKLQARGLGALERELIGAGIDPDDYFSDESVVIAPRSRPTLGEWVGMGRDPDDLPDYAQPGPVRIYRIRTRRDRPYIRGPYSAGSNQQGFRRLHVGEAVFKFTDDNLQSYPTLKQTAEVVYNDRLPPSDEITRRNKDLARKVVKIKDLVLDPLLELIFADPSSITRLSQRDMALRERVRNDHVLGVFNREQMSAFILRDFESINLEDHQRNQETEEALTRWKIQTAAASNEEAEANRSLKKNRDVLEDERQVFVASTDLNPDGSRVHRNSLAVARFLVKDGQKFEFKGRSVQRSVKRIVQSLRSTTSVKRPRLEQALDELRKTERFKNADMETIIAVILNDYGIDQDGNLYIDPKGHYKRSPKKAPTSAS